MKKILLGSAAALIFAGAAQADLTVTGFVEFEAYTSSLDKQGGEAMPGDDPWKTPTAICGVTSPATIPFAGCGTDPDGDYNVDFGVDVKLNFDYVQSTKAGLTYGAHFELDGYMSDSNVDTSGVAQLMGSTLDASDLVEEDSRVTGRYFQMNDAYIYIESALGRFDMGDIDPAGLAAGRLSPVYTGPDMDVGLNDSGATKNLTVAEKENIKYSTSIMGADLEASTDDDGNYSIGLGYSSDMLNMGATVTEDAYQVSLGGKMGNFEVSGSYLFDNGTNYDHTRVGIAGTFFGAAKIAAEHDWDNAGHQYTNLSGVMFLDRGLYISASTGWDQDATSYTAAGVGVRF